MKELYTKPMSEVSEFKSSEEILTTSFVTDRD